jgi:hypothetical protein
MEHKLCVLVFSTTALWNISHSKKKSARHHKRAYVFMRSTNFSSLISMQLVFYWQIFEKYPYIKVHENPPSVSRAIPCTDRQTDRKGRRTDRHDESKSRFSQFCGSAYRKRKINTKKRIKSGGKETCIQRNNYGAFAPFVSLFQNETVRNFNNGW